MIVINERYVNIVDFSNVLPQEWIYMVSLHIDNNFFIS